MSQSNASNTDCFSAAAELATSPLPARKPNARSRRGTTKRKCAVDPSRAVTTQTLAVDPSECCLWRRHNRRFDLLDEDNCRDLIESFISAGRQELAAIVRPAPDDSPVKYEIVTGARRFWTVNWLRENNYPHFKYLVEVRDLTDEQAFLLSNLENMDRYDISAYERSTDYASALHLYFNGKQSDMAQRLNKSEVWISRYITLSKLPVQIANAYADWRDLKVTHAPELLSLLSNKRTALKLLQLATELHAIHADNKIDGNRPISGPEVFKRLKSVGEPSSSSGRGQPIKVYGKSDKTYLSLNAANRHALNIQVSKGSGASIDDLVSSFRACLLEYYES